jgi:hypothetical protein
MKVIAFILFVSCIFLPLIAQEKNTPKEYKEAIEDNSFFIEEAYNQEDRVVQHISNAYYRTSPTKDIMYSFTQEWPLYKYLHQISYTIPYSFIDGNSIRGIGDIMINYRYQLFYNEHWACISPRLSLIFPTGDYKKDMGFGAVGVQINLPVSKRLSDLWVVHFNAGTTIIPAAKGITTNNTKIKKTLLFYNLGGSVIWLTNTNFNFMLECVENFNSGINTDGIIEHSAETIINPGVRGAINIGKLQIVPGISLPLFISNHEISQGFLFYLSFEHPY